MFEKTTVEEKHRVRYRKKFDLQNPEDSLSMLWNKIPQYIKITFISACISGFIAHFYIFARKLPNHDDIGQLFGSNYGTASGRWLLPHILKLDGSFSTPWLIGVLAILILALAVCFAVSVMRIRRPLACILTAAIMVTFPAVTATMTYMFSADAYFLSLALACFAAFATNKHRLGFIPGAIAITLSMGIYQSYFGLAAVLMVGALLFDTMDGELSLKQLILKGMRFLAALALGIILYMIIVKITSVSTELVSYMGISEMGHVSVTQLPQLIYNAYLEYWHFFIKNSFYVHFSVLKYAFAITAAATLYLGIFIIIKKKLKIKNIIFLLILALLYPLAGNLIYLMVPDAPVHILMLYGMIGILIAPIALMEYYLGLSQEYASNNRGNWGKSIRSACCWVIVGTLAVTAYAYTIFSNEAYLKMELAYEQTYSFSTRLLSAIERTDGYDENTPIILIGSALDNVAYGPSPELDGITLPGIADMNELVNSYTYGYFLRRYVGASNIIYDIKSENSEKHKDSYEVKMMPNYPAAGSIKVVDNYIIVKFS